MTILVKEARKKSEQRGEGTSTEGNLITPTLSDIKLSDLLHLGKVGKLKNDQQYSLNLGKEKEIECFGRRFTVRQLNSSKKLDGSKSRIPPINFLSMSDFFRMQQALMAHDHYAIEQESQDTRALAWYFRVDEDTAFIEVGVKHDSVDALQDKIVMTGAEIKNISCILHHELEHANGRGEFHAFRKEFDLRQLFELVKDSTSNLDVMLMIRENYPPQAVTKAEGEFERHCKATGFQHDICTYWQRVEGEEREEREENLYLA